MEGSTRLQQIILPHPEELYTNAGTHRFSNSIITRLPWDPENYFAKRRYKEYEFIPT